MLSKQRVFLLFAVDSIDGTVLTCLQGNPYTVDGRKPTLHLLTVPDAREVWTERKAGGWSLFQKGLLPGAVLQRIRQWNKLRLSDGPFLDALGLAWKAPYDQLTEAITVNSLFKEGAKILYGTESIRVPIQDSRYPQNSDDKNEYGPWAGDGDIDNLWNQEGFFEDASDQGWFSPFGYEN